MLRSPRLHAWLLTLLCVAMLLVPAVGAHLHECLDGKEPPASLHLFDLGIHHADDAAAGAHVDNDVPVGGELLSKGKIKWTSPLALVVAAVLLGLLRPAPAPRFPELQRDVPPAPRVLRPPLRGPPLPIS